MTQNNIFMFVLSTAIYLNVIQNCKLHIRSIVYLQSLIGTVTNK